MIVIEDSTGVQKVIFYHKSENEKPQALKSYKYVEGSYARVYGSIRIFKEEKAIVGNSITAITEHNDITNHWLKVFNAHCIRKQGLLNHNEIQAHAQGSSVAGQKPAHFNHEYLLNLMKQMKEQSASVFVNKTDLWASCQRKMTEPEFNGFI